MEILSKFAHILLPKITLNLRKIQEIRRLNLEEVTMTSQLHSKNINPVQICNTIHICLLIKSTTTIPIMKSLKIQSEFKKIELVNQQ